MSDLRTLLHETAGPAAHPTPAAVADEHLAQARRALRRRNARRVSVGSTLVAAAAIGAIALGAPSSAPTSPSATPSTPSTPSSPSRPHVRLVAYHGSQPTGYTLDAVPAGWQIDHDDLSLLTLAPAGATSDAGPDGSVSLVGKIAISTEKDTGVPSDVPLDHVQVGGRPAVIAHMLGAGDTRTLFVQQPSGTYLVIQVWSGLGWDNDEIATFAESVHINADALTTEG